MKKIVKNGFEMDLVRDHLPSALYCQFLYMYM